MAISGAPTVIAGRHYDQSQQQEVITRLEEIIRFLAGAIEVDVPLSVLSAFMVNYKEVDDDYTTLRTDHMIGVDTTDEAITITLAHAYQVGQEFIVQDAVGNAGTNTITIDAEGGDINGGASETITADWGRRRYVWNGTLWLAGN
jgi:hypothetical protein